MKKYNVDSKSPSCKSATLPNDLRGYGVIISAKVTQLHERLATVQATTTTSFSSATYFLTPIRSSLAQTVVAFGLTESLPVVVGAMPFIRAIQHLDHSLGQRSSGTAMDGLLLRKTEQ
jgi:hypothetical protein